ncbi:hypothetical protein G9E11_01865 [Arthrobacter sp. IA7]|uniref:hypothetical protein n=1 Tax=Arthrobacter ipis TaxID=2716202 RepID=UPI001689B697|nr:hypothetical protein [Arthrobacter ipis]MBD1541020.1 hypothetical protein [Arthrobacter ipis]
MPRFTKESADGNALTVETAIPTETAALRSQGWNEQKAKTSEVKKADAESAKTTTK